MSVETKVSSYYTHGGLIGAIDAALRKGRQGRSVVAPRNDKVEERG